MTDRDLDSPVRLVATLSCVPLDNGVAFVRGGRLVQAKGDPALIGDIADRLRAGTTRAALSGCLPLDTIDALLARLDAEGWLTAEPAGSGAVGMPWERQHGYLTMFGPEADRMQQRLRDATVGILGVGGIGALVAQHLVAAGVGELWLVDFDAVASHNLNRQYVFGTEDIGRSKVDAAMAGLGRLSPHTRFHPVQQAVRDPADLEALPDGLDLLVVAADTPPDIAAICWRWAAPRNVAMTAAAVGLTTGFWGPLLVPERGDCHDCFHHARQQAISPLERQLEKALGDPTPYSFGPSNSAIAAMLGFDVCRYLAAGAAGTLGRRGILNFEDGRMSYYEPDPGQRCAAHAGAGEPPAPVVAGTGGSNDH
ncbi:MAG: ThiF family adenylyltransferase [Actinocatenispora sp.]